jgi:hypothetical protein
MLNCLHCYYYENCEGFFGLKLQVGISQIRKTPRIVTENSFQTWQPTAMPVTSADVKVITPGPLVTPLPPVIPPPTNSNVAETANQDSQDEFSSRGSGRDHSDDIAASGAPVSSVVSGITIKEEPGLKDDQIAMSEKESRERAKDRSERSEKSERHRDRWV